MENGYVICLLKYILGNGNTDSRSWDSLSENNRPVSLGYFGRVDVVHIDQFKDYMDVASVHNAGFTGSRKQILLYPLNLPNPDQIKFQTFDSEDAGRLPFQPVSGKRPCFCCLSILNISQSVKEHECNDDYASGIRKIAAVLARQIDSCVNESGKDAWLPYAIMGLLGTEDICVIFLSDSFNMICTAINRLRRLETKNLHQRILDNSHSILMVDFCEDSTPPKWDDTIAEIRFSLKSGEGLDYIMEVKSAIARRAPDQDVVLNSQIGEYDAVIRCPASALGSYLYGYNQMLNYGTTQYRDAAYQSETLLFQRAGISTVPPIPVDLSSFAGEPPQIGETLANKLAGPMEDLVKKICACLEDESVATDTRTDSESSYVSQVLYRLLKDFMRNVSVPVGGTFQHDLSIQFQVAINAILHVAQTYRSDRANNGQAQQNFDMSFSQIVEAMSKSMQAASQIDRLCFEEQQSHLQNTGTYHKVLLAYYGIVKAILELIYTIPRKVNSRQTVLVPLLSFGHTQIICSNAISSSFREEGGDKSLPARLICITLPYQALSNIPKYIGPLVHEIFHYSTPSDRESRNEDAGKCLTAVAFRCFLDQVGSSAHLSDQLGMLIFSQYREEFLNAVGAMFEDIWESLLDSYRSFSQKNSAEESLTEDSISSDAFFRAVKLALTPCGIAGTITTTERLYCEGWKDLRKQLLTRDDLTNAVTSAFQLTETLDDDAIQAYIMGIWEHHANQISGKISAFLSVYETYLREIPPDLFDIGCVTLGEPKEVKAQQYLWQVHSIRKDKLYYSDGRHTGEASCWIDGNSIRIGTVLDYLVFGSLDRVNSSCTRKKCITKKLEEWYSVEGKWALDMAKNKSAISMDYEKYCTERIFANLLIGDYIRQIDQQIGALTKNPRARKIMERLTKFYQEYYRALNELDGGRQADITFDLAIRIIEFYQSQQKLSSLCQLCGSSPVLTVDQPKKATAQSLLLYTSYECEIMVFKPSKLSDAVTQVFEFMCPKAAEAPLWFRGQAESDWKLLPNAMRSAKSPEGTSNIGENGLLPGMRKVLTLAKAKILPQGDRFHKAEWLALLQHYKFKTTLLDWSEDLHSALYFAIEPWIECPEQKQTKNASVHVLNPILYNLARDLLEKTRKKDLGPKGESAYNQSVERLKNYLVTGCDKGEEYAIPLFTHGCNDEYQCYFDLDIDREVEKGHVNLPMAAMTPATNERMKMQAGVFTFCDVRSKPELVHGSWSYDANELSGIQQQFFQSVNQLDIPKKFIRPFLYNIVLNCNNSKAFTNYLRAIGMRKYRMYPELTSLADDIMAQSF